MDVESEKGRRADTTLISHEPSEQSGERSTDECRTASGEPHALRESGQAAQARKDQEKTEDDRQGRALDDPLKGRTAEPADRARRAKTEEDLAIDVRSDEKKTDERAGEVGKRHHRYRETNVELCREDRGEHAADPEPGDRGDRARKHRGNGRHDGEQVHALILLCG